MFRNYSHYKGCFYYYYYSIFIFIVQSIIVHYFVCCYDGSPLSFRSTYNHDHLWPPLVMNFTLPWWHLSVFHHIRIRFRQQQRWSSLPLSSSSLPIFYGIDSKDSCCIKKNNKGYYFIHFIYLLFRTNIT